jgi:hypothetical protein
MAVTSPLLVLSEHEHSHSVIVMDNISVHVNLEVEQIIEAYGHLVRHTTV